MKNMKFLISLFAIVMVFVFKSNSFAQSEPVLYFCEKYDATRGEVNVSDRFYPGYLTVMVKADKPLGLTKVSIQFDRYNNTTKTFAYYKKFAYTVDPTMKYVFFAKNDESDMAFEEPGIYRVFLLDSGDKTVASALIEIIK